MKRLLLDDERDLKMVYDMTKNPIYHKQWDIVRNYKQFINYIEKQGMPNIISFDHDLGEAKSGMDCAHYIIDQCIDHDLNMPDVLVHSMNPVGKENIMRLVNNFNDFRKYKR